MDKLRFNLIRILSEKYKVTLLVPVNSNTRQEWIEAIEREVDGLVLVDTSLRSGTGSKLKKYLDLMVFKKPFYSSENEYPEMYEAIRRIGRERSFHFIQLLSDFSACYLSALPKSSYKITGPTDDTIESVKGNAILCSNFKERAGLWFLVRAVRSHFKSFCSESDLVLFHSDEDLNRVKKEISLDFAARVLPVPTDIQETASEVADAPEKNAIVFVGGMGAPFNSDAAERLVVNILPLVRQKVPEVVCYLVGNNPPQRITDLGRQKGVIVTGQVPDVKPYIKNAAVYVSPIRTGTGIKTKIIEALSLSKAIVASPQSLQGLWKTGDSMLLADNDADFAAKVADLLIDPARIRALGQLSKLLYDQHYSPQKAKALSLSVYEQIDLQLN